MNNNSFEVELENKNVKNHMVQVRMNDEQFRKFWKVKNKLKADNNSMAIRMLIETAAMNNGKFIADNQQKQELIENLEVDCQALLRQLTGIANNLNQIARGVNSLIANDPEDEQSWQWIVDNVQFMQQQMEPLKQLIKTVNQTVKVGE